MTREVISRRWDLVGRLAFVVAMCFCAQMVIFLVQALIALAMGDGFGSTGPVATAWRWLAWAPALIFLAAVLVSFPLPRWTGRETRWSAHGTMRMPPIGRGVLLLFGCLLFLSTGAHSMTFLPADAGEQTSASAVTFVAAAIALLLLRILLGTLRLLPRSWRVLPPEAEPLTPDDLPDVDVPEQRFAPRREPDA